jgi:hypothetical protein
MVYKSVSNTWQSTTQSSSSVRRDALEALPSFATRLGTLTKNRDRQGRSRGLKRFDTSRAETVLTHLS